VKYVNTSIQVRECQENLTMYCANMAITMVLHSFFCGRECNPFTYNKKSLKIPKGGNQNPYIKEEETTQWPKEKAQKDKQRSTKHTHKTKDRVTRTPFKTCGELRKGKHFLLH
jgi:hypothetical protein